MTADRLSPQREAEIAELRYEIERLQNIALPELRRGFEAQREAKVRWRDRAQQAEAEVAQWRATFGADALPGALARLKKAEDERDRLLEWQRRVTEEVEEFEDAANDDPDTPNVARLMISALRLAMGGAQ